MLAAAAVVIVTVVAAPDAARSLGIELPLLTARLEPNAVPPAETAPGENTAPVKAPDAPKKAATDEAEGVRKAPAPPAKPAARARAAAKPAAKPAARVPPAEPVLAARLTTETVAPVAAVPAPPPVVETARAIAPAAPSGRVFEPTDVDQAPQVATRVEPRIPGELKGSVSSDIVIVRVLVSQSGHPYRISLLRRSRVGPSVDDLVVAAVNQWTFSPARKRGEAVSSWYNVGVPLGHAN
jgi:hypothetical protein